MEQRQAGRYNLQVPAHIETIASEENIRSYEWKTRNVSTVGAFLLTDGQSLENGTKIKISLYLNSFSGSSSWIKMNGQVVRIENEGVGVSFSSHYQFVNNTPYFNTIY